MKVKANAVFLPDTYMASKSTTMPAHAPVLSDDVKAKLVESLEKQGFKGFKPENMVVDKIVTSIGEEVITDLKKDISRLTNVSVLKAYIRSKLGLGSVPALGKLLAGNFGVGSASAILTALKILAPYVWYYVVMSVLFRVVSWVTGNRKTLLGNY
jgi:hypothetical protein